MSAVRKKTTAATEDETTNYDRARALLGGKLKNDALILEHIWFWFPLSSPKDHLGRRWLVRTVGEFKGKGKERLNRDLGSRTILGCLRRLRDRGLIEVMHAPHPYHAGKPHCTWIRPLKNAFGNPYFEAGQSGQLATLKEANLPLSIYIQLDTPTAVTTDPAGRSLPPLASGVITSAAETKEAEEKNTSVLLRGCADVFETKQMQLAANGEAMPTTAEILAAFAAKPAAEANTSKPLVGGKPLHIAFRSAWLNTWPAEAPPEPFQKNLAHMKQFLTYAREQGMTDVQVIKAVQLTVTRWEDFKAFVKARTSNPMNEARPRHFTFTGMRDQVVNFWRNPNPAGHMGDAPKKSKFKEAT